MGIEFYGKIKTLALKNSFRFRHSSNIVKREGYQFAWCVGV